MTQTAWRTLPGLRPHCSLAEIATLKKFIAWISAGLRGIGRGFKRMWQFVAGWRRSFRFWLAVILVLIVLLVTYYVMADRYTPFTVDAYVQAYVVQVAPQVGGQVQRV